MLIFRTKNTEINYFPVYTGQKKCYYIYRMGQKCFSLKIITGGIFNGQKIQDHGRQ